MELKWTQNKPKKDQNGPKMTSRLDNSDHCALDFQICVLFFAFYTKSICEIDQLQFTAYF